MFQKFSNLKLPATNGSAELGVSFLKFGLSQKLTKLKKIFLMVLTNQLIYLVNVKTMRKIFFSNYVCFSESPNFKKCQNVAPKDNLKMSKHF